MKTHTNRVKIAALFLSGSFMLGALDFQASAANLQQPALYEKSYDITNPYENTETANIWSPRASNPAFAQPGQSFDVEVRSPVALSITGWTAELQNDLRSWNATVTVKTGKVYYGGEDGYIFTVTVPEDISPELFTLVLKNSSNDMLASSRSIKVEQNLEQDFYILHTSDEHVMREDAIKSSGKSHPTGGNGSFDQINWAASVINIINPRMVLHTGDNIQFYHEANLHNGIDEPTWAGNLTGPQMLSGYMQAKSNYTAPTVMVGGNHDTGYSDYKDSARWTGIYESIVGATAFSIHMGSFYLLASEWTQDAHLQYSKDTFNNSFNDPTIKYRLWASHFYGNEGSQTLDYKYTIPTADKPSDLALVGHNHIAKKLQTTPFPVFSASAGQNYEEHGFYNFEKQADGSWVSPQASQSSMVMGIDRFRMYNMSETADTSVPTTYEPTEFAVTESFANSNDGTKNQNSVVVTNNIKQNFYDGRVRFLMPRGEYSVEGGTILSQYNYDTDKTAVLVKIDIKEATTEPSSLEVTINKTIPITSVENGNHQANVSPISVPLTAKAMSCILSDSGNKGTYAPYSHVNYNAKGAHLKGLENNKSYYAYIMYEGENIIEKSEPVLLNPWK